MSSWFYNPDHTFQMGGIDHLFALLIFVIIVIILFSNRNKLLSHRRKIRLIIGWTLILSRITLDIWYISTGQWTVTSSLPLELCSIASIMCGIMLLTKNRFLFEVFYFIAIGGAIQAILTPDLYFRFPQLRLLQFFIDHFFLIFSSFIMICLYHYTITIKSLIKSFVILNGIAFIVFILYYLFSANYMFLMEKPSGGSLLDVLGPSPYYFLSL